MIKPAGVLYIGDPHATGMTPGLRLDEDFVLTIANKLNQCVVIANKHNLVPVILGDFFHRKQERDIRLLVVLTEIIHKFKHRPYCLQGNHDLSKDSLSEKDPLTLLHITGVLNVVDTGDTFKVADVCYHVCNHGSAIPNKLDSVGDTNVLLTHHDLAMKGAYPDAIPLKEIEGCTYVVNGHMHKATPNVTIGSTTWINPGNIVRLTKDLKDYSPKVVSFVKGVHTDYFLEKVEGAFPDKVSDKVVEDEEALSAFADQLAEDVETADGIQTTDADKLKADIDKLAVAGGYSELTKLNVLRLLGKVVDSNISA